MLQREILTTNCVYSNESPNKNIVMVLFQGFSSQFSASSHSYPTIQRLELTSTNLPFYRNKNFNKGLDFMLMKSHEQKTTATRRRQKTKSKGNCDN
jgi:hypothetical protein